MGTTIILFDIVLAGIFLFYSFRRNMHLPTSNIFLFTAFFCLLGSVSLILWENNILIESRNRLKWPTTTAVVVKSSVTGNRAFRPDIAYEYKVNGRIYHGNTNLNTPGFGNKRSRRDTAERIVSDYKLDQQVTIHYNPNDPAESYIRPGPQWSDYVKSAIGHILFIMALFGLAGNIIQKLFSSKTQN